MRILEVFLVNLTGVVLLTRGNLVVFILRSLDLKWGRVVIMIITIVMPDRSL